MSKTYNFCNNCGKTGHAYHMCKLPITSIGIIAFKPTDQGLKYLMIRRKDSLGYVDFMRGRYPLYNKDYLMNIINEMTDEEKNNLLNKKFDDLWSNLWGEDIGIQYRGEEKTSKDKFMQLKEGYIFHDNKIVTLKDLIEESNENWQEPEWGFPKGRRNYQEKDLDAAIREWEEETGYHKHQIRIVSNLLPYEEIFTGSNNKSYKHKYYIALFSGDINVPSNDFQATEVSAISWSTFGDCNKLIRPYNLEKKGVLNKINKVIQEYRLYQ